mgnify:FL=1
MQDKPEVITFTTFGYKHYTENLLASVKKNDVNLDIKVYALDVESYNHFKKSHNNVVEMSTKNDISPYMKQTDDKFGELMLKKFECIYLSLIHI